MIKLTSALLTLFLCQLPLSEVQAQTMTIKTNDGQSISIPTYSIRDIRFERQAAASLTGLTGDWMLIVANNGVPNEVGIYTSTLDTIRFTAKPTADGLSLRCHADRLYWRSGQVYPADWTLLVEQNEQGQRRLGWVLDKENAASTKEFLETKDKYLENGFFYFGASSADSHRYIYLLSMNIDTQKLEGMTLWTPWLDQTAKTYTLSQIQQIYGLVSEHQPLSGIVGYFEIWASPRFEKLP